MARLIARILLTLIGAGVLCGVHSPAFGQELPKKIPVTVTADKLYYDRMNDIYTASGHVRIEQEGIKLEADKVVLNNKTGEAVAEGKVYLQEKGDVIKADKLQINVITKAGVIYNGDIFMSKDNVHLTGEKIERRSETVFHVENGIFTTCDHDEWYLKAREINVDMDKYATGKGVSFHMTGLPVFYTPYLLFPVRRQTGLLIPEAGYSRSQGFTMKNAFFWAISDYKDMTLYSDYRARYGLGTGIEYRYANSVDSAGSVYYNYFDIFPRYRPPGVPSSLWEFKFQHHEEFAEDLSARADINLVSDPFYYRDVETRLEFTSIPYLDSNAFYVERWDTASLYLLGQYSMDLTKTNETTVQKLPELRYSIFEERLTGPLHLNFDGSAVNFTQQAGTGLRRVDFNPNVTAAFGGSGLGFTPRAGVRATFYDRSANSTEPVERKYYYAGADLNARFSKVYGEDRAEGVGRIRHSIEPTISYSYVPYVEQGTIPQFDSVDTVTAQNLVTVSLTNRLTAHYKDAAGFKTFDLMVFRLSQSYDVKAARNPSPSSQPRSQITGEIYIKTPKLLTLSATENYNTYTDRITSSSESAAINTDTVQFDVTHQYLESPRTEFLIGGTGLKLGKWNLNLRAWHDLETRKTIQQEYTAHYTSQCWGIGISLVEKPGDYQYLVMFDLKGLGSLKF